MVFLGDIELTDDQFYDYIISQNNKLNMYTGGTSTFIRPEEAVHIKDIMKSTLSDIFAKYQNTSTNDKQSIAEYIAAVFFDPDAKKLSDEKIANALRQRGEEIIKWARM